MKESLSIVLTVTFKRFSMASGHPIKECSVCKLLHALDFTGLVARPKSPGRFCIQGGRPLMGMTQSQDHFVPGHNHISRLKLHNSSMIIRGLENIDI
jgi:hypothetical protein